MSGKILLVVTSCAKMGEHDKEAGWYLPEVAHPYYIFKAAGYDVVFASPEGGKAPLCEGSKEKFKDDPACKKFLEDSEALSAVDNTATIASLMSNITEFKAVFYAGGYGPMFDLPDCAESNAAAAQIYEADGIVAAVCHGPAGMVNVKLSNGEWLLKGKTVTCLTNAEEESVSMTGLVPFLLETRIRERGASVTAAAGLWASNVEVCDRVVTGQNPASAAPVSDAMVKAIRDSA